MRKVRGRAGMVAGILLACCACAVALDPSLDISQYAHTSWKVREGFTKSAITSLAQTPDGYLWLGTELGLVRFDGVRTVPWQPPESAKLPDDHITTLFVAKDGTLWIGTWKGLASWSGNKLTIYPELGGQAISSFLQDRDGTVWVGGLGTPHPGRLCAIGGGKVQCRGEDGIFGIGVAGLYEDFKGNLWLGVPNGVWRWKPGAPEFFSARNGEIILGFVEDDQGSLLVATQFGLSRLVESHINPYALPGVPQAFRAYGIVRDRDGGLWVRTGDRGLMHIHHGKADVFGAGDGLSGNFIQALLEDREGSIWAASAGGLDRFREYPVANLSVKQGLSHNDVLSVAAATDGSVWISTGNGLNRWKDDQISVYPPRNGPAGSGEKLSGQPAQSMLQDRNGKLWVSASKAFGYVENERWVPLSGVPTGIVYDVVEAGRGDLWLSNQTAGLIHLSQGKVVQQIPWARLGHTDFALRLAADPSGRGVWLGFSDGGLAYVVDGEIRKTYSTAQGLGRGRVSAIRFGPRGSLWAATQGGLSRIKDDHIQTLTSKSGLPCDAVHWSVEDDLHSQWLYTVCGMVRIARSDMDAWVADPTKVVKATVYDASDGVPSSPLSGAFAQPVIKSSDGKLWFVTQDGVGVIDPHHLAFNKLPPPVHIEQVTADDKTYDATNGLRLPPHVRYLAIDYTALSLAVPEKVHFRYKLEGEDKDWREVVNDRQVQYTNLAPKHYRFRVLASNNSGVWNETGDTLEFVIPPAWYQTNWFRGLCAATFLAMLWLAYELRVRYLERHFAIAMEARVGERTRIARELHDTLLQSFQGLTLIFGAVLRLLPERPVEARQRLDDALKQATQAITEARDAVQDLGTSDLERDRIVRAIEKIAAGLMVESDAADSAEIRVHLKGEQRTLNSDVRHEAYRIGTEALRNAFRHAEASRIDVEIRFDDRQFGLLVHDDGKGIDQERLSGEQSGRHFGLYNMRERAEKVGGRLELWSKVHAGTEIKLTIPAARAYADEPQSSRWWQRFSGKDVGAQETKVES